jgi:hypothetical protein
MILNLSNLLHICANLFLFKFLATSDFNFDCTTCSCLVRSMSHLLSSSSSIIGLLLVTVSGTLGYLLVAASRFPRVIQSQIHAPRVVLPPRRPSQGLCRLSNRLLGRSRPVCFSFARRCCCSSRRRCAIPFDTHFGNAAGKLEDSKTMSLWNLRQLLMGARQLTASS